MIRNGGQGLDEEYAPHTDAGWAATWRAMVDAVETQTAAARGPLPSTPVDPWVGQAGRFASSAGRTPQPDSFMKLVLTILQPGDTVLDVGAGSGRHACFLAQHAARVVAVEPSASMRAKLEERVTRDALAAVEVIDGTWPDVDVPQCDIAICAHVLYGVSEIAPFLSRLDRVTVRACFILLGVRQPAWALSPFWKRIHGVNRLPLPGANECGQVLLELGITPQVTLIPAQPYTFGDEDEALADLRWRLHTRPADDGRLRDAIRELLHPTADGRLATPIQPAFHQVLWWRQHSDGAPH